MYLKATYLSHVNNNAVMCITEGSHMIERTIYHSIFMIHLQLKAIMI